MLFRSQLTNQRLDAERRGVLIRDSGQTIIEPSGGNTGIGLVMAGNVLGYKVVLVIPDNYSPEKQKLLRLYGARVVLSDSRLGNNSHGEKCMELQLENPSYVMLNQQRNGANPQTHRDTTAPEILRAFGDRRADYFVSGIGTGGHITGIGETLKAAWPGLRVMGVEPEECDLLKDQHAPHHIQGLIDSLDNFVMIGAYGWAFSKPVRKLYYNITITAASVVVEIGRASCRERV